jgi:hypothetical protein
VIGNLVQSSGEEAASIRWVNNAGSEWIEWRIGRGRLQRIRGKK